MGAYEQRCSLGLHGPGGPESTPRKTRAVMRLLVERDETRLSMPPPVAVKDQMLAQEELAFTSYNIEYPRLTLRKSPPSAGPLNCTGHRDGMSGCFLAAVEAHALHAAWVQLIASGDCMKKKEVDSSGFD